MTSTSPEDDLKELLKAMAESGHFHAKIFTLVHISFALFFNFGSVWFVRLF